MIDKIAKEFNFQPSQVKAVLSLLEEKNTIPFIARYRKEQTKGLNEEEIRLIGEYYEYQTNLLKRKEDVLRLIEQQGKLTKEIIDAIQKCEKLVEVDDIYRPYQQKKKTRASLAINSGLQPLCDLLLASKDSKFDLKKEATKYCCEAYKTSDEVIQGVCDIIAEMISDDAKTRAYLRKVLKNSGLITTKVKKNSSDESQVFQKYYDYQEKVHSILPHRIMAINRGESEKVLTVNIETNCDLLLERLVTNFTRNKNKDYFELFENAIKDGFWRLLYPSVEREIRSELTKDAQERSIDVFSLNLEKLLLQLPMKNKFILGLDPGFRTGCKLAVVNDINELVEVDVIFPHKPQEKIEESKNKIIALCKKYPIEIIAIGNGTASRESEIFIADCIKQANLEISYSIVSEAGASVYSASALAKEEFPNLAVQDRSAVSIARRLIDPLSELIKIDPKSIGVGQYQHDLPQKRLSERLNFAVEKAVNLIGVNVNQASLQLLQHISGINKTIAKAIIEYRKENGKINTREQLKKIKGIGEKSYQQCAGFLRILDGENVLDSTSIHPESYEISNQLLKDFKIESLDQQDEIKALTKQDIEQLAIKYQSDSYTIKDIISSLIQGKKMYSDQYKAPLLKKGVLEFEQVKVGDIFEGVVRNVVDFGAFIDIGLHHDALIHKRNFLKRIQHPSDMVCVGDIVEVEVIELDIPRQRVQLKLKEVK